MKKFRQQYYDLFSAVYDKFVAFHSSDRHGDLREYLSDKTGLVPGDRVLDVCTGTGAILGYLLERTGENGMVIGLDFSEGMLKVAKEKWKEVDQITLIKADAEYLPFKRNTFDAITCAHAFYEISGKMVGDFLIEVARVLKKGKPFLIMEHEVPENRFVRMLFYLRLLTMGAKKAIEILHHEVALFERYFRNVERAETPTGRSKIMVCYL